MSGELVATREQVVGRRLAAQHLGERLPPGALVAAAGVCGVQDSPPGSGILALSARVRDVTTDGFEGALAVDRQLVRSRLVRGAPFVVPTADAAVFTTGVLPPTEAGRLRLVQGAGRALGDLGLGLDEAVALTRDAVLDVLPGRRLPIGPLGAEAAERIAPRLTGPQRTTWSSEGPYAAGQPLGEAVVHFCLGLVALEGVVCFAPREDDTAPFVLVEEWLGAPFASMRPETARAELLRRYLHAYGPSTKADFAAWLGVRAGDATPWWDALADELAPVRFDGRRTRLLATDLDALASATLPTGVRLLPPHDPHTQARDRATLVDDAHRRDVWKTVGDPGALLVDGEVAGIWRPRKRGRALVLTVTPFGTLRPADREAVEAEAAGVATLRGADRVEVAFERG